VSSMRLPMASSPERTTSTGSERQAGKKGWLTKQRSGCCASAATRARGMPLVANPPGDDPSVIDFCSVCRKCAINCPVGAIPAGDRTEVDEGLRWAIEPETCYRYWQVIGTDCATCVRVCPYSHPDSPAHNLVRRAIRSSGVARRPMLWLDDLFYGRFPARDRSAGKIDR